MGIDGNQEPYSDITSSNVRFSGTTGSVGAIQINGKFPDTLFYVGSTSRRPSWLDAGKSIESKTIPGVILKVYSVESDDEIVIGNLCYRERMSLDRVIEKYRPL